MPLLMGSKGQRVPAHRPRDKERNRPLAKSHPHRTRSIRRVGLIYRDPALIILGRAAILTNQLDAPADTRNVLE